MARSKKGRTYQITAARGAPRTFTVKAANEWQAAREAEHILREGGFDPGRAGSLMQIKEDGDDPLTWTYAMDAASNLIDIASHPTHAMNPVESGRGDHPIAPDHQFRCIYCGALNQTERAAAFCSGHWRKPPEVSDRSGRASRLGTGRRLRAETGRSRTGKEESDDGR